MEDAANNNIIVNYLMGQGVVAYQRGLARAVGCHSAGLLLSQFWYWSERQPKERDGWFFMTQEQIFEETVMGRREQETARRKLRDLGVLEEAKRGAPAKLWFRVNTAGVIALLEKHLKEQNSQDGGFRHPRMAESAILESRKPPSKDGGIRQSNTKNTSKTTSENTAAAPAQVHTPKKPKAEPLDSAAAALVEILISQDVNRADAQRLAREHPEECRKQLDYLPYKIKEIGGEEGFKSGKGAYLRAAIEGGFAAPTGYKSAQEREAKEKRKQQAKARETARSAHRARFEGSYQQYLKECEDRLARSHPEAYSAFLERDALSRERLAKLRIRMPLEAFDKECARLERLREHFCALPDAPIADFWQWDKAHNTEHFADPLHEAA